MSWFPVQVSDAALPGFAKFLPGIGFNVAGCPVFALGFAAQIAVILGLIWGQKIAAHCCLICPCKQSFGGAILDKINSTLDKIDLRGVLLN